MQNGRISSPKLRPRLSSSENRNRTNMPTCFERERGVDKNKIRTQKHHAHYYNSKELNQKTLFITLVSYAPHEQVTIHHNIEVGSINFIENQQTMFSVNFATTIHRIFWKAHLSEPFGKFTYSTIIYSSMIASTHGLPMNKKLQLDTQKDRRLYLPPNIFTSRVMSTIITHAYSYSTGYMCLDLSSPHDACQDRRRVGIL